MGAATSRQRSLPSEIPSQLQFARTLIRLNRRNELLRNIARRGSRQVKLLVSAILVGLSGLEPLTSALSERFWPVAAQRSQDRIARPERCEASRGLASLWCAFEARESRSPLRQRPLSRSSHACSRGGSSRPSRSLPCKRNGCERSRTEANETRTETRDDLCLIRWARSARCARLEPY